MSFSELHTLLQQQVDSARELTSLLEREREALEGKDPEQITEVVTEKQALLSQLSQIEMNRERLLHSLGIDNTPEALDLFIQENDENAKLATVRDELRSVLDNCFQLNRVNGGIAELSYHYLAHSLAILRGGEGENETTYGPQGKTKAPADNQRSLAKA
ncbi:MAG: flagellar protein FlgN [Gammaproteobacteria bacterium]|nr:flagellar protein FlgN [Gammaproteobacteria bacterium]